MPWLLRRLAMLVASMLVASFVIFGAMYLAPGNPISALSGAGVPELLSEAHAHVRGRKSRSAGPQAGPSEGDRARI